MNKQLFFLRMLLSSLLRRRSRLLVALLAVGLGATLLSGLVTLYKDVPRQLGREFRSYGANLVITSDSTHPLTVALAEQAAALVPQDKLIGHSSCRYENIRINELPFMASGCELEQLRKTAPYWQVDGQWPQAGEVLLGQQVAASLGAFAGDVLELALTARGAQEPRTFKVAGLLKTGSAEEKFVYLPLFELLSLTSDERVDITEFSIQAGEQELGTLAQTMRESTGQHVRLVRRVTHSEVTVLSKLKALVYIVTVVVLVLTMVCVATTMVAVVAERRREIGLRKALGASDRGIFAEFMGESVLLGLGGGVLGAVLGYLFADAVSEQVFGRPVQVNVWLSLVTVLLSIVVTALSCVVPVKSASRVDPAQVLRGE